MVIYTKYKLMNRLTRTLLFSLILLLIPVGLTAQGVQTEAKGQGAAPAGDSTVVSLLTCSPGPLVYELYGHTALRVREYRNGGCNDWVFNYGTFSFDQPHFMWRFMLGDTDYELGVVPYSIFYDAYVREGRGIYEQRLNLTQAEAKLLVDSLAYNVMPEHATYRYNFFYDNCVTRAIDRIAGVVGANNITWPQPRKGVTLRGMVEEFSAASPWNEFGQNLLLGAEVDRPASLRDQLFSPVYAEHFVAGAKVRRVVTDSTTGKTLETIVPLAGPVLTLLPPQPGAGDGAGFPLSPMQTFVTLLVLVVALTAYELWKKRYVWQVDTLLLIAQGLAGCIIAFLFFFSAHPAVGSNWLVTLFNPLPLLYFPWLMKAAVSGRRARGLWVELAMIVLTLVWGICGLQAFPAEVYVILAILAIRTVRALLLPFPAVKA